VVGAAGKYGPEALQIATTVKLARALWIIPVSLVAAVFFRGSRGAGTFARGAVPGARQGRGAVRIPWFIGLFVLAVLLNTWLPVPALSRTVVDASHAGLTLTLFLIGSGLTRQVFQQTGVRPLMQGVIVWGLIAGGTLWAVMGLVS
jgi:uncharacterized membrane protein YadS